MGLVHAMRSNGPLPQVFVGRPELAESSQLDKSAYAIQVGDDLTVPG